MSFYYQPRVPTLYVDFSPALSGCCYLILISDSVVDQADTEQEALEKFTHWESGTQSKRKKLPPIKSKKKRERQNKDKLKKQYPVLEVEGDKSVKAISTPVGGQPGYKIKRSGRG